MVMSESAFGMILALNRWRCPALPWGTTQGNNLVFSEIYVNDGEWGRTVNMSLHPLGKGEVVSSILPGSTSKCS
jgi:hypothetical protein